MQGGGEVTPQQLLLEKWLPGQQGLIRIVSKEKSQRKLAVSTWEMFMGEGDLAQSLTCQDSLASMPVSELDKLGSKSLVPPNTWSKVDP